MKDTIRCCISCILPCGALDVIRIVHANGRVEEISRAIRAEEVMQAYPKHVLRRPPATSCHHDVDALPAAAPPRPAILPPNAELQRGKIYFLMPVSPEEKTARRRRKKRGGGDDRARLLVSDDQYLSEILSENGPATAASSEGRRGRVGVWRPHLESISEASNDTL